MTHAYRRWSIREAAVAAMAVTLVSVGGLASAATVYSSVGNGESGFGGVLGTGTISIDSETDGSLDFTFTKGTGGDLNDAVVIYLQAGSAQGFTSTANFDDDGDPLRQAISGFDGTNRSILNFNGTSGLSPNYAIAFDQTFGGLWQLVENGGPNSLPFVTSVNLTPTGTTTSATYTFSLNASNIGLTPGSGESFSFVATYLNSGNVFRSNEAFGGGFDGTNPGNSTVTMSNAQVVQTVPEPGVLFLAAAIPAAISFRCFASRRRRQS